ncbi:hypothetical protein Tco_1220601 [Tanacetum coccineum]
MNEYYCEQNSCYDLNSFGFDQYQPPQSPDNHQFPQETSNEILQARDDLMEAIQAFLKEYDHIPPNEKCMALLLAEERFLKIKQAMEEEQNQPEMYEISVKSFQNILIVQAGIVRFSTSMMTMMDSRVFSDDTSDVPNYDNNHVNVEIDFVESLIDRDTSIVHSSKIDPILEEFAGELAHIDPISPEIVEADFDPNDDTSSDDDDFEDVDYVSFEEMNDVEQEEKKFDLEDILQIQDVILHEKLLNVHRLIYNIESLKNKPTPDPLCSSLLLNVSIEPDQEVLISIDNSNDPFLELPEFESFHFDPSFPCPPPEPPDVEICLNFESDTPVIDNFEELNEDQRGSKNVLFQNVKDDDSFTFVIRTFLPFLTYPEVSLLSCSTGSEDTIFDPGIST